MKTEIQNKRFAAFVAQSAAVMLSVAALLAGVNYLVDASQVITSRSQIKMAQLALSGNVVAASENYNERVYQIAVVDEMDKIPETVVIGSSRGMFLGEKITGYENLYNNCVSGACLEDDYALLGLYYEKFEKFPGRVIIETSPWVFFGDNPEARWTENYAYRTSCKELYQMINGHALVSNVKKENPFFSVPYFQYNMSVLGEKGFQAIKGEPARVSTDSSEAAEYPDGSIRYESSLENAGEARLEAVRSTNGAVTYENVNNMTEMNKEDIQAYENLIARLLAENVEIIIYMQPFSVTQCRYIYDQNTNPAFSDVEAYIRSFGKRKGVKVIGGFDARNYDISDRDFIDFMHLDKNGTKIVWDSSLRAR